jgi:predicted MFS family arabinose efflux permease
LAPGTLVAFVGSLAVVGLFLLVEGRVRWPLVDLSLFRNARFTILVVAGTVANIAYAVTIYLSTLNLQQVRGLDPLMAGLAFLGPSIGAALGGPLSGRLATRYPPLLVMGLGCVAAALSLATLAISSGRVVYVIALSACGFTMGLVYAFTTVATQAVVRPERAGEAAGVALTSLVTLAGVGVAVSGTMLEVLRQGGMPTASGIPAIFLAIAAVLLPAAIAVLAFRKHEGTLDHR